VTSCSGSGVKEMHSSTLTSLKWLRADSLHTVLQSCVLTPHTSWGVCVCLAVLLWHDRCAKHPTLIIQWVLRKNKLAGEVAFLILICVCTVPVSKLYRDTEYPKLDLVQYFPVLLDIYCPVCRPWSAPFTSFPIHYSLTLPTEDISQTYQAWWSAVSLEIWCWVAEF
jgi:hypothetical protein